MSTRITSCLWRTFGMLLAAARTGVVVDALEMIGSNLCNANDVLLQEIAQSRDATIFQGQNKISSGEDRFMVGTTKNGARRALLAFDFEESDFPRDALVECTEIRLVVAQNDDAANSIVPEITLHRVTTSWETTGGNRLTGVNGGTALAGDVTWLYTDFPRSTWKAPGGDFADAIVATKMEVGDVHSFGNTLSMARLVQDWIDVGASPFNAGFMLVGEENSSGERFVHYHGVENAPDLIPRLIVTYTSPSQGVGHRDYTSYVSTLGSASTSSDSGRGGVSHKVPVFLLFCGGTAFGALVVAFFFSWRSKRTPKSKGPEPDRTSSLTDLQSTKNDAKIDGGEIA